MLSCAEAWFSVITLAILKKTESAAHAVNLLTKTLPGPSPRKFPARPTPDSSTISDTDSFILDTHSRIPPSPSRSSTPVPRMGVGSDFSISSDHEEKPHGHHEHSDITRVILWLCGRYLYVSFIYRFGIAFNINRIN